jgi:hypothetical protein
MQSSQSFIFLLLVFVGLLALASIIVSFFRRPARQSYLALTASVLPAFLMLASFYSLAIHLYHHLGGWPTGIGDHGFPPALILHENISVTFFMILMLVTFFVWPVVYILCVAIRRWRVCLFYLGAYAFSFLLCSGAMLLAPSGFWNWWWD